MDSTILQSGRDTLFIAVPFLLLMMAGLFRLDEVVAASDRPHRDHHAISGLDEDGEQMMSDPDGTYWNTTDNSPAPVAVLETHLVVRR